MHPFAFIVMCLPFIIVFGLAKVATFIVVVAAAWLAAIAWYYRPKDGEQ